EKIHTLLIDPQAGLQDAQADDIARKIGVPDASIAQARQALQGLYKAFWETDASQAEINPLILTGDGKVCCGGGDAPATGVSTSQNQQPRNGRETRVLRGKALRPQAGKTACMSINVNLRIPGPSQVI
ncbi:ATP-grasp domain-containing protein, partial [Salmonella enterica]|uniref:ATP-grasp domain-containing protein n=1 Tax=Salmonella enterica TaxID=28901 RepID=UPI00398C2CDB